MTKRLLLFFSLLIFSEDSIGMQSLLMVRGEQFLSRSFHTASRYYQSPKRFFSSTSPIDPFQPSEESKRMQVFSRPTYDRIAKYILSEDESVRIGILKAFTGIQSLSSARQLDEHYNPFDPLHNIRNLINSPSAKSLFENIRDSSKVELSLDGKKNKQASETLKGLSDLYGDLSHAFPHYRNRSTVDFLCKTDFGYITIEFQVAKQDYWDKRALAYIASIYGNQLRPKPKKKNDDNDDLEVKDFYSQIQNVIGINLLGDGSAPYWNDGDFMRDYTFMNQRGSKHKIPAMRLIQYSLGDVDFNHEDLKENPNLRQWIEFFKSAHEKESMPPSIDESVKKAYEMIRVDNLKKTHPDLLKASDEFFAALTEHDQAVREQGMAKANQEFAKKLARKGMDSKEIEELTGLSEVDVLKLKNQESTKE